MGSMWRRCFISPERCKTPETLSQSAKATKAMMPRRTTTKSASGCFRIIDSMMSAMRVRMTRMLLVRSKFVL